MDWARGLPEKVTFEQRLWKRGGNRPGERGEEVAASAKTLRSECAQAPLWNWKEARGAAARVSEGRGVDSKITQGLRPLEGLCLML